MLGFKGLLPRQLLSDESFQPIIKKAEDYRKVTQVSIDYYQQINKILETYRINWQKNILDVNKKQLNQEKAMVTIFEAVYQELRGLVETTNGSFKQLGSLCNTIFHEFSNFMLGFQQLVRTYQTSEQILFQLSKKYFRTHKNMLASIDYYKTSFTDVKLIYNVEEKNKRYLNCETLYKAVSQEHMNIVEKVEKLSTKKGQIFNAYQRLSQEFSKVLKVIGSKIIAEAKNFVGYFCGTHKKILTVLASKKYELCQIKSKAVLSFLIPENQHLQIFQDIVYEEIHPANIPYIFSWHSCIKDQHLLNYHNYLKEYLKSMEQQIELRKIQTRKVFEFFSGYFKVLQKNYQTGIKDILSSFEKIRKKLAEIFGNRLVSFLKSINSIFDLSFGVNEKLMKRVGPKLLQIQSSIEEENKLLKILQNQIRSAINKFIGKKEMKKIKEQQFTEDVQQIDYVSYRKSIKQNSDFMIHLLGGFNEKLMNNYKRMNEKYDDILNDWNMTINELFSLCCEYEELYFGSEQFTKNFRKYQLDIEAVLQKQKTFFEQISFAVLKKQSKQISFDGQFYKVQQFKKLKKPIQVQPNKEVPIRDSKTQIQMDLQRSSKSENKTEKAEENPRNSRQSIPASDDKYSEFLQTKINFFQTEELVKTFSCALADKIILQGRIYITTQRVCFHSKFNSGNVFFGGTFIQIPKKDVKKIEKRTNAIFFDNSILISTVNGEVFFTSFFSRNEAYDLLCKTFEMTFPDNFYEQQDQQLNNEPNFLKNFDQQDDMKNQEVESRTKSVSEMIEKVQLKQICRTSFKVNGLNASKIVRIFYQKQEVKINGRVYPSFLNYFKGVIDHKDVQIGEWDPNLLEALNISNFKSNCQIKFKRKIMATVPVSNSGVPFMPKTASSVQYQSLYLISKHKYILQSQISTTGVPYSDTFKLSIRTIVQSTEEGEISMIVFLFVSFVKQTMMRSIIESKSTQQTTSLKKVELNQMKKFLLNAENKSKKSKQNKKNIHKDEQNEKLEKKQQQNIQLKKQLEKLRKMNKLKDNIIIGMGIFGLLLLLMLYS